MGRGFYVYSVCKAVLTVICVSSKLSNNNSSIRFHSKSISFVLATNMVHCSRGIVYTHHQKNSCTQKEVSDCNAIRKEDKGYQEQ